MFHKAERKQGIIYWKSLLDGYEGQGQPVDYYLAVASAEQANKYYAHIIHHWVVEVFPDQSKEEGSRPCRR